MRKMILTVHLEVLIHLYVGSKNSPVIFKVSNFGGILSRLQDRQMSAHDKTSYCYSEA